MKHVSWNIFFISIFVIEPYFKPEGSFRGSTKDSLTVGWTEPSEAIREYIDLYRLKLTNNDTGESIETIKGPNESDSLFTNLSDGTYYTFTVRLLY